MNKIITLSVILVLLIAGYFLFIDSKKTEAQYTKYTSPEIGLEFDYPTGYVLDERMPVDLGTGLIKVIILERLEDKSKEPPVNSEGAPTITISVFENNKKQFSGVWADENIQYSNINLKRGDIKEVVVGGANTIQYMADGLYSSNNAVVAHGDNIYVITGQFIDQNSDLQKDFQPLLESIKFIPKPGQE